MRHRSRAGTMRGSYGQDAPPSSIKRLAPLLTVAVNNDGGDVPGGIDPLNSPTGRHRRGGRRQLTGFRGA